MVKAQIHAGGRGKAGGVRRADSAEEAGSIAGALLGKALTTAQTGPQGRVVHTVWVEKATAVAEEAYLGVAVDRARRRAVVIASSAGGVDIETTAQKTPEKVVKEWVEPGFGLRSFQAHRLARAIGWPSAARELGRVIAALYRAYEGSDALLAEINPLVLTADGDVLALDAKLSVDDNALFRHPDLAAMADPAEQDPLERRAGEVGLNYIKLDGSVGCLVNGAGLAMATMDLIAHVGARPANFLDVGGGATREMIAEGVRILVSDPDVRAVFINIFGGILRCDVLAEGVVDAAQEVGLEVPVIVRLEGTHVERGREILASSGLSLETAEDLADAARRVGEAAGGKGART
jgi:succinyl-CoA synthetase beta subunit